MATVILWTGLEARALREALRMSMREFARRTNLSPSTIADNEAKGEQAQLRRATQAILDRVLEQAPADAHTRFEVLLDGMAASANRLVGSLERSEDPAPTNGAQSAAIRAGDLLAGVAVPGGSGVEDVRRRTLTSSLALITGIGPTDALQLGLARPPRRPALIAPELVDYFRTQLAGHYLADIYLGPHHLVPVVTVQCCLIAELAAEAPNGIRQDLLQVGTAYAALIGWLYQDAGDVASSWRWRDHTLDMAHRSGDRQLLCYALTNKAMLSVDSGDGAAVVDYANAALSDPALSHKMRLGALVQAAHGYSLVGDAGACERSLDAAEVLLDRAEDGVPWGNACRRTPRYFDKHRATCYGRLGRPADAVALWDDVLADTPPSDRRDLGVWYARHAVALADLAEPDRAVRAAATAARLAQETGSVRLRRELLAVTDHAAAWRDTESGRMLIETLTSL